VVQVTNIVGEVETFVTFKSTHVRIPCTDNYCEFDGKLLENYLVEVNGDLKGMQRFSVVFRQNK
jgi:hypothetical protein